MRRLNALILVAIIICVICIMLAHKEQQWRNAIASWMVITTDVCDLPTNNPVVVPCGVLTTIKPPPLPSRSKASGVVDQAAWAFAVSVNAAFVSYIGGQPMASFPSVVPTPSGIAQKTVSFNAPTYLYTPSDAAPLAVVWVSSDRTWAVVVIRGTMTATDLSDDANFNYTTSQLPAGATFPGNVHPGVAKMYSTVAAKLRAAVPYSVTQLTITGHSLGAGIGFLFASDIMSKSSKAINVDVYGVAPPRVGDSVFAASINRAAAHCGSLINLADTVPTLPWSYMLNTEAPYTPLQYSHVGSINVFNNLLPDMISNHMLPAYYQGLTSVKLM